MKRKKNKHGWIHDNGIQTADKQFISFNKWFGQEQTKGQKDNGVRQRHHLRMNNNSLYKKELTNSYITSKPVGSVYIQKGYSVAICGENLHYHIEYFPKITFNIMTMKQWRDNNNRSVFVCMMTKFIKESINEWMREWEREQAD